jgi:hypothetical protein
MKIGKLFSSSLPFLTCLKKIAKKEEKSVENSEVNFSFQFFSFVQIAL